jgi:hypothetical protein
MRKGPIGHHILDNSNAINYEKIAWTKIKVQTPWQKNSNLGIFLC